MKLRTDAARIFLTAVLIYAAFWNPWLQSSMGWNSLDTTVSLLDGGRWDSVHFELYDRMDTITFEGRVFSTQPPGLAVLMMPMYLVWREIAGPVETVEEFRQFNRFLVLGLGVPAAALSVVQVFWLAGWLGAGRREQLWAAGLFAFGTQNFLFGTMLFKEGLVGLAVVAAVRLSIEPGGAIRRTFAGSVAGLAAALVYQAGLLIPLLAVYVARRGGTRQAAGFLLGCAPFVVALGVYHTWLFERPWRTGYATTMNQWGSGYLQFKPVILLDLLAGPGGGLFLYAPFLLLALFGSILVWRDGRHAEVAVVGAFAVGLWIVAGSWLAAFGDRARFGVGLGPRMMFPAVPLLAALAAPALAQVSRRVVLLVAIPSVICGYLGAQAGLIPGADPVVYALKTWISGTGMGVLFKEALPVWLGLDTLHTVLSRPEVGASDLLRLLPTAEGARLAGNQLLLLGANLLVLGGVAWFLLRLWKKEEKRIEQ
jgi:hypothetical protein